MNSNATVWFLCINSIAERDMKYDKISTVIQIYPLYYCTKGDQGF